MVAFVRSPNLVSQRPRLVSFFRGRINHGGYPLRMKGVSIVGLRTWFYRLVAGLFTLLGSRFNRQYVTPSHGGIVLVNLALAVPGSCRYYHRRWASPLYYYFGCGTGRQSGQLVESVGLFLGSGHRATDLSKFSSELATRFLFVKSSTALTVG